MFGDVVGFTIGDEFGFGVGVFDCIPFAVVVAVVGFTIGLDVGFGLGFEFGFGVGFVVIGVPLVAAALIELLDVAVPFVAAAGFVPDEFEPEEFEFADAELPAELFEPFEPLEFVAVPLEPLDPALPPV